MRHIDVLRHVTAARVQGLVNPDPDTSRPLDPQDRDSQAFVRQFRECLKFCDFEDDRVPSLIARIEALEKALAVRNRSVLPRWLWRGRLGRA